MDFFLIMRKYDSFSKSKNVMKKLKKNKKKLQQQVPARWKNLLL